MARISTTDDVPSGAPMAVSMKSTRELDTSHWRSRRPLRITRPSPCNADCPAGSDLRAALHFAADGDVEGAWRTLLEYNPLPAICGRVCDRPCERGCHRAGFDGAVAIQAIERAIGDEARARKLAVQRPPLSNGARHVAIIGAGPAGIGCAYHLALRGHLPTLFDAMPEPGGRLRYATPSYRLPREVLDAELETLWQLGVGFQGNARFGESLQWEDLNNFAAVFVAIGAGKARDCRIPGDRLSGVRTGLEFLRAVTLLKETTLDGPVVVIGGGAVAIDTARTARRLGASDVTVALAHSPQDVSADSEAIVEAEAEGVRFLFDTAVTQFVDGAGDVRAVEFQRTRVGAPDSSGRPRREAAAGSEFRVEAKHVFVAMGEDVEVDPFVPVIDTDSGRFYADQWGRTTLPAVFAGGEAATGAGSIAGAIGSGRLAAEAIDAWLAGRDPIERDYTQRVAARDVNYFHFRPAPRVRTDRLEPRDAARSMREIVRSLDGRAAVREALRCFTCGTCTECDTCLTFCPEAAVSHDARAGAYAVDLRHCKGCGICAEECPRGAIVMVPEAHR